MSCFAAARS